MRARALDNTSMLVNTLNTNEIKNALGTEVEFDRLSIGARTTEYKSIVETPALPNRLIISHQETSTGVNRRRRSVVRFDKTVAGEVDMLTTMKGSAYVVLDIPIGLSTTTGLPKDLLAQLMSFVASLGASTTILYDGSGNGATALITGGI